MNKFSCALLSISIALFSTANAEDKKPEISEKEKKELIDIFGGKVKKTEEAEKKDFKKPIRDKEDFKKPLKEKEEFQEKVRDFVNKHEAENREVMKKMTEEERRKHKKEFERRRAEVMKKMKNMTPEQKKAYWKELMKKKRK